MNRTDPVDHMARMLVAMDDERRHGGPPTSHRRSPLSRWWRTRMLPPTKPRALGLISVQMMINPFELLFLVASLILGFVYIWGVPLPASVKEVLPDLITRIWAANLALGGTMGLLAGFRTRSLGAALKFVQAAWFFIAAATTIYSVSVFITYGLPAFYTGTVNICVSIAAITRAIQIQRFFIVAAHVAALALEAVRDSEQARDKLDTSTDRR